jgi:hypothetical protein
MNQERIEHYLSGRLSEHEARAFEDYCVANPEFARQVEFEQRLRDGIRQVSRGSTEEFVRADSPMRWGYAVAAGVVLALIGVFAVWRGQSSALAPAIMAAVTTEAHRSAEPLRLALVRGSGNTPVLPPRLLRVEISGLFDTASQYSIALDRLDLGDNIDTVAIMYGVRPSSPVTLQLMLDGDQIEPGAYSLRVRRQNSGEDPLDFEFLKH